MNEPEIAHEFDEAPEELWVTVAWLLAKMLRAGATVTTAMVPLITDKNSEPLMLQLELRSATPEMMRRMTSAQLTSVKNEVANILKRAKQ